MKITSLLVMILLATATSTTFSQTAKVVTYNIRLNTPDDGENAWPNRKHLVTDLLRFHEADIIGMQEVLYDQLTDISLQMPGFDQIGVGREDGKAGGEYSPIFYDSRKYQLKNHGWFWLSETPEKPSMGWDAACKRICTYALFEDYDKRKNFWVFNTHFDHVGEEARINSARLILQKIDSLNSKGDPVVLMGDFNLTPESKPIERIENQFFDSKKVSAQVPYGPEGTYNGFNFNSELKNRIDYIFVKGKLNVQKYGVLTDSYEKRYPSDHLPVLVEIEF
ncbi:endonuclease/exonuclease/phosphatase family protein [Sunxiuqinia dokdonensis]|uniref:Metal-dependent hydrolase n=1 Tax=Sunxiuqinia dokdonensis TaxID=1409788 RepID=A0A0L8VB37_9BACT|nr:endonuclease/exonuclease/phosphatase family protein [Sunxiuqinia dokdonensis]KOH45412.1 metal-dependent hydrolase [Sunxiuqinia dokdonensis]